MNMSALDLTIDQKRAAVAAMRSYHVNSGPYPNLDNLAYFKAAYTVEALEAGIAQNTLSVADQRLALQVLRVYYGAPDRA